MWMDSKWLMNTFTSFFTRVLNQILSKTYNWFYKKSHKKLILQTKMCYAELVLFCMYLDWCLSDLLQ